MDDSSGCPRMVRTRMGDFFFKTFPVFSKFSIMSMYYFFFLNKKHCYHITMKNNLL